MIGVVVESAQSSPKPDYGKVGLSWPIEGWLVSVEFTEINKKIRPKDHIDLLRPHLPTRYSPIQSNGNGLQSVYLARVPVSMAEVLINLIGPEYTLAISSNETKLLDNPVNDEKLITDLVGRTDIGKTTKDQLILSRRGQGIFKANFV